MINAQNLAQRLGGKMYSRYGTAPCPVCQTERQFPDAIAASGRVRMYRESEVESWVEAQANPLNTHKPSNFSGGKNELS
jgi:predicted DNA-binding transcriptional regulator AlpA